MVTFLQEWKHQALISFLAPSPPITEEALRILDSWNQNRKFLETENLEDHKIKLR